jgi:hypothetical protein
MIGSKQGLNSLILFLAFGIMGRYLSLTDEGRNALRNARLGPITGAELFIEVN